MSQKKMIGFGLLALGVILLLFGFNAADSPAEELAESFTGRYSDDTMMYLIGGGVAAVVGFILAFRKG